MFGPCRDLTGEPTLAEGWLPVAEIRYRHISPVQSEGAIPLTQVGPRRVPEIYRLEAFASTDPALATHGVTYVKFDLAQGAAGTITVTLDDRPPVTFADGKLTNEKGELLAVFDAAWKGERPRATAKLTATRGATFALATKPLPASVALLPDYAAHLAAGEILAEIAVPARASPTRTLPSASVGDLIRQSPRLRRSPAPHPPVSDG